MCQMNNGCIVKHDLFNKFTKAVYMRIKITKPPERDKIIIELLQKMQPPKVSGEQINRFFYLLRHHGINLDKDRIPKNKREFHAKFKSIDTRKKRNRIHLKPDSSYIRKERKRLERVQREQPAVLPLNIDSVISTMLDEPEPNFHYL